MSEPSLGSAPPIQLMEPSPESIPTPELSTFQTQKRKPGRPRKNPPRQTLLERGLTPIVGPRGGLGQKVARTLNLELRRRGIPSEDLPPQLQDIETARSRKGKVGQIVVHALSGVQKSTATNLARKLENEISPSRDDLLEKLQAAPPSASLSRLVEVLSSAPQFSLARAIAEAKADVAHVLDGYAKGALALKKMETVLEIYKQMPHLMKDVMRHAIDKETDCEICLGVGKVTAKVNGTHLLRECPRCQGSGKALTSSPHKEFAVTKVLEMSEMLPKKGVPMVTVNQGVQVNQGSGGDLLARLSKAADEILYGNPSSGAGHSTFGDVIDAEQTREVKGED